ncbi:MAG TPA: sigma-70 family RNA polymerase sigma factor, partial [Planctomycetota bacterium]|nr:sigma-70 family RNA polymerase sigma factor [Planctomycetota bacterium]
RADTDCMDREAASRAEDLLAHTTWMGGLARHLVRDPASADDLVQETWLAAVRREPSFERPIRPWLARVLGRIASRRARGSVRREAREAVVARREALPSAADVVARAELHRRVVDAVLELPEPYRRTLLERYFDGLEPADIARRTGEPAGTVRWRVSRGLELLRERLDARHGGDRAAWCAALLPLAKAAPASAGVGAATVLSGALAMKAAWTFGAAAAAALVATVTVVSLRSESAAEKRAASETAERAVAEAPERAVAAAEAAGLASGGSATREAAPHAEATPAAAPSATAGFAVLARAVDASGAPISGARLVVWAHDAKTSSPSSADGIARLAFDADGVDGRLLRTRVEASGRVAVDRPAKIVRGQAVHLGDVVLERGGSMVGRVTLQDGTPVAGAHVIATGIGEKGELERERRRGPFDGGGEAADTQADGRFRIDGVAAGGRRASAGLEGMLYTQSGVVDIRVGEETSVGDLVLEPVPAEDVIEGRVLAPDGLPVPNAEVAIGYHVEGSSWMSSIVADAQGRFRTVAERRAPHQLHAEDHRKRWPQTREITVSPGASDVVLQFREPRVLEVRARRAEGGLVDAVSARAIAAKNGETLESATADSHAEAPLRLREPEETYRLTVDAPGFTRESLGPFDPGDGPPRVDVVLAPIPSIQGRVLAQGKALPGASVSLWLQAASDQTIEISGYPSLVHPTPVLRAQTDESGRFVLTPREGGSFVVRASSDGFAPAVRDVPAYVPGTAVELTLALDAGGAIEGRLVVSGDKDPSGTIVSASRHDGRPRTMRVGADGRFRFDLLTPGKWQVQVSEREVDPTANSWGISRGRKRIDPPTNCEVVAGVTTTHDIDLRDARACTLEGELRVNGKPAAKWEARLGTGPIWTSDTPRPATAVAADGRFSLSMARPGRYTLSLTPPGGELGEGSLTAAVELRAGAQSWQLDLSTGSLRVEGVPAGEIFVYRWAGPSGAACMLPVQSGEGVCNLPFVPAGLGRILRPSRSAAMPEEWPVVTEVNVPAGGAATAHVQ